MGVLAKLRVLLVYLVSISLPHGLATAGATMVVWADLRSERIDLWSVLSRIGQVLLRLVVLSLCIGSMCVIAGMFFLVPGILAFAFMSFAIPVLVIEDTKVSVALRRGITLASMRLGALLSLYAVVLFLVGVAIVGTIYLASTEDWPWWVGISAFWVSFVLLASILMMGTTAAVVHLYRDVCEEQRELAAGKSQASVRVGLD
jgi:hypothetical protein